MSPGPDDLACAAALVDLPGMTPVRLARLLDGFRPGLAWRAVAAGSHPADPGAGPRRRPGASSPPRSPDGYAAAGVQVLLPGRPGYPGASGRRSRGTGRPVRLG